MNSINWNHIYNANTIEQQFDCFINNIINIFNQSFPIESIKNYYKNRNPWINKNLKNGIKIRDNLYHLSKRIPTRTNIDNYKKYKNLSNQRKTEINYYREQFDLHKTDLKRSWNIIKNIINKEDNRRSAKELVFLINNQYISDGKIFANTFNNYFVNVGSSLAKNIPTETDPLHYIESLENSIHIPEIYMDEVRTIISAITNSASGYDELPASILKQCTDSYLEPLTHLINLSISLGIMPDELKVARVIPIFKGEDEQLVQNYRPISVLPFFSKKNEKIIATCVIER